MHWKLKARIQNAIARLPDSASYAAYYWVQRNFGGLRRMSPVARLSAGVETWKRIRNLGCDPAGRVFFEVGTGRVPLVPLAYWLMGAEKTITIDLNPYLREELIQECVRYMSEHQPEIQRLFGPLLINERFADLLALGADKKLSTSAFLEHCHIAYVAPGDAADTQLPAGCVDFHTSYTVFEHIPLEVLSQILEEGNRIVSDNGMFVHCIDYSDHFSHSDRNLSAINFLQYSDAEWNSFAGNRYMYTNRLRHDDFLDLFQSAGHHVIAADPDRDLHSQELLATGRLPLNDRFRVKPLDILSLTGSWIVSKKTVGQKVHSTLLSPDAAAALLNPSV